MARTAPTRPQPKIIALSLLLYRWLLSLGPVAFRRDYAAPALQDFRQCCRDAYQKQESPGVLRLWPGLLGETIPGLLAEYLTELFRRKRPMLPTVRRSIVAVFWAFVLFLFASIALGQTADPVAPFDAVGRLHPEVAITYAIFTHSGEIALLAVLLGGLPILFTAVKRAFAGGPFSMLKLFLIKPKQALLLLGAALLISICFVGYILATEYIFALLPHRVPLRSNVWDCNRQGCWYSIWPRSLVASHWVFSWCWHSVLRSRWRFSAVSLVRVCCGSPSYLSASLL